MPRSKCPICNGPENQTWFVGLETIGKTEYAVFIVECWSGNTHGKQAYHIYKKRIKIADIVEIDQLKTSHAESLAASKEYETEINDLTDELEKQDKKIDALETSEKEKLDRIDALTKELKQKQESIEHLKALVEKQKNP